MKKNNLKDTVVIGFAVFAIFFGAGNLIFPPQIGLMAGEHVGVAMIGMIITGIMFPMLAMAAVANMGSNLKAVTMHVTPWWHSVYFGAAILILHFGTIPRCGSVAYEIGLGGIISNLPSWTKWVFLIVFFGLSWLVARNRSNVVDVIGKFVTPILLIALVVIVVLTIVDPLGSSSGGSVDNPFTYAMLTSYNTGDIGTGILCAGIFLGTIKSKGYNTPSERKGMMFKSLVVAFVLLTIIYGGLCYLGSQGTSLFTPDTDQTSLLVGLVSKLAGYGGMVILSIAIIFACFTTSAGMIATGGEWILDWTKGKIDFKIITLCMAIVIMLVASTGASTVVKLSTPLFMFIFPMSVVMTIFGLFHKLIPNDGVWKGAIFVCTVISIYDAFNIARVIGLFSIETAGLDSVMGALPLSGYGFGWIIPTIIGAIVGGIIFKAMKKESYVNLED